MILLEKYFVQFQLREEKKMSIQLYSAQNQSKL